MPGKQLPASRPWFPWRGEWIELHADGSSNFYRCIKCHRELRDEAGKQTGLGPTCREIDPQRAGRLRENAKKVDRVAWRRMLWYERFGEEVKSEAEATINAREQTELRSDDGEQI